MCKLGPIRHFLSPVSCDSLVLQGRRCVKFGVITLTLSYWSLEVQHGTSWQRTLWRSEKRIVALHKDGVGFKKISKTLKLSCSTVAKTMQQFNRTGSTQNRPRHGIPKKLRAGAQHHIQRFCLGKRRRSCCRCWRGGGSACQCSDHTLHTASNWSAWLSSQKEASSKDDAQKSLQTVCWRQAYQGHGLLEPCPVVWWDQGKLI